jgi:predicted ATPase/DNA-binding winged helix-turn-helix (wHTH) protein
MKQFEPFRLDAANGRLWRQDAGRDAQIALPPKPFAVLQYLVENPGRLIRHDELLDALWPETFVQPQVLRTYMLDLRKALGDDAGNPRYIQTLPKRGYCFVAPVTDWAPATVQVRPEHTAVPAEGASRNGRPAGFVNRADELTRLWSEFERANAGERRVLFLAGEAGIGKTALADAFCRRAMVTHAADLARGQCVPGVCGREEYYPVLEALGQLCALPHGEEACRILARLAPAWLAHAGQGVAADAAGQERAINERTINERTIRERTINERTINERTISDLCGALDCMAVERPLILVFEDLHWADGATLNVILALARRQTRAKLMVLATYRPRSAGAESPLRELKNDLLMRKLGAEIAVTPLRKAAIEELLREELKQQTLPDGLGEFVHRRSEGNPLFAIAIAEHLIAQRILARQGMDGAALWELSAPLEKAEPGVPEELAQMVEMEIERLSAEEQRVLEAGSLMPVAFPAWAVAAALEQDALETEEICDRLARRLHFVERAGEDELPGGARSAFYVFAHELYREVLYRRQAAQRRARRSERIAERLGELFKGREADVASEMAMHFEAAGCWQRAVEALRAAAQHAEGRLAHAEAAELLERAEKIVRTEKGTQGAGSSDRGSTVASPG